ncbi:hypothetical protein ACQKFG_09730 [Peribacillus sp. NPDC076916]|uniref:hypothetical protein n=1 Tax=Peribacillus sp. NPDC076916 TaxID=3390608 RepID=UPI003CFD86D9
MKVMFFDQLLSTVFLWLVQLNVDFRFRHSLSAGGPGASSTLRACGVSPGHAFPQESRAFLSNQLCFISKKELLLSTVFLWLVQLNVDFRSRHSLSAGGPGASSACACGVSPGHAFPAGSLAPFSPINFCYKILVKTYLRFGGVALFGTIIDERDIFQPLLSTNFMACTIER